MLIIQPFQRINAMHQSRRLFLKLLMATTINSLIIPSSTAKVSVKTHNKTLLAFFDTLIPECAAGQLLKTIHRENLLGSNQDKLLKWGQHWLDSQAKNYAKHKFHQLTNRQKIAIVELAQSSPSTSAPYYFFYQLRRTLMQHHYSSPNIMAQLGFTRSPQPFGYPQHDQAPA